MSKINIYYSAKKASKKERICIVSALKQQMQEKRCTKEDYLRIVASPFLSTGVDYDYRL